jgi:hypothetical protein
MPTAATTVAPVKIPTIWARAAPLKVSSTASTTAPYIAKPPRSGIGRRCTLRGPGRSTMPTRSASARTGTVSIRDANSAIRNASRPAGMSPLFKGLTGRARPVPQSCSAGLGPGSQGKNAAPRSSNTILLKLFRFNQDCLRCGRYEAPPVYPHVKCAPFRSGGKPRFLGLTQPRLLG